MVREDIEGLVKRWTQAVAEGRLDLFDELLAEEVIDRSGPTPVNGVESFKARTRALHLAFADIAIVIDDLLVGGEAIAWRWALTGRNVGPFAGVAATGHRITLRGVNVQRLKGKKVVEHWSVVDVRGATDALRA